MPRCGGPDRQIGHLENLIDLIGCYRQDEASEL